jgi:hypothetical protein
MGLGSFIISLLIPQKQAFLPVFDAIETIFEPERDTLMVRWQWVTAKRHRATLVLSPVFRHKAMAYITWLLLRHHI